MALTVVCSALSGVLWGVLVYFAVDGAGRYWWLGVIASPLIGVVIGLLVRPFRYVDWQAGVALSLVSLNIAAAIFGAVSALGIENDSAVTERVPALQAPGLLIRIVSSMLNVVVGMALSGFVFLFWPLAYSNHALIWWCQRRGEPKPQGVSAR